MYSITWAQEVLLNYRKLCTRAQQMNAVICLTLERNYCYKIGPEAVNRLLIDSIRGKVAKRIWPDYKRLNKRTPLDKFLLNRVCESFIRAKVADYEEDVRQNYLTFV